MDDSVLQDGRVAAIGVVRDSKGNCIGGFSTNLGQCSITRHSEDMKLAWNKDIHKIAVQMDSFAAIQIIQKVDNHDHRPTHWLHVSVFRTSFYEIRR
ncbi:hypothetical protein LINPERPRIM_LOCUS19021 [Linum perenne]